MKGSFLWKCRKSIYSENYRDDEGEFSPLRAYRKFSLTTSSYNLSLLYPRDKATSEILQIFP